MVRKSCFSGARSTVEKGTASRLQTYADKIVYSPDLCQPLQESLSNRPRQYWLLRIRWQKQITKIRKT